MSKRAKKKSALLRKSTSSRMVQQSKLGAQSRKNPGIRRPPRYLANIENKGQHPSVQVFLELMSRYHISVDQILHGETMEGKSTERMQFETLLDELTDAEIKILTATAQALLDARTDNEGEN